MNKKQKLDKVVNYVLESWKLMFHDWKAYKGYEDSTEFLKHTNGLMDDIFSAPMDYEFGIKEFTQYDKFYVSEELTKRWIESMD